MRALSFLAVLFTFAASSAQADYFYCQITQFDNVVASVEADYRVLNATVTSGDHTCSGEITAGAETHVTLKNSLGDVAESTEKGSVASAKLSTLPRHNEYDVHCTCGMQ